MATENLREKIVNLENLIKNDEVQMYLQHCIVEDAEAKTGDAAVDEAIQQQATQAQGVILHCKRKLDVRRPKLEALKAELNAAQKA